MIKEAVFVYRPQPFEHEKASYAYLVSIVTIAVGLPLPILNLVATVGYYLGIRRSTYFIRWHGVQAILTQLLVLPFNSIAFWWTLNILLNHEIPTLEYGLYMLFIISFNIIELVASIITADRVRKLKHVRWWVSASLTDMIVKPDSKLNLR